MFVYKKYPIELVKENQHQGSKWLTLMKKLSN